jgi:hypothetical protein
VWGLRFENASDGRMEVREMVTGCKDAGFCVPFVRQGVRE